MEKMKKLFDRVLEVSCIALMSVMTILVTYQVITRYIFNKPSAVSEVLARYMFVWMVLLCAAYVFGLREHMNIPFVKDKLPPRAFMFVDVAGETPEDGGPQIMLFADLGIFKLLCQLSDPSMLLEYVPEGLQKLYNYKKPQRDDLITTLRAYLDRNLNLSKTAQDLYVHYKTAVYRIEKIEKLTGIDFDNANEVLAVRIGLVVYKMIENYNKDFI